MIVQNKSNNEIWVSGYLYKIIEIVAKELNFKLNFTIEAHRNTTTLFENIFTKLENNEMNALPIPFYINSFLYGRKIVIGNYYADGGMAIIVPRQSTMKKNFSLDILVCILSFPVLIISFYIAVHFMKLKSMQLRILHIFQILVGVSSSQPRETRGRILFFTIAFANITYSSLLLSKLDEIKVVQVEQSFRALQDLYESKIIYPPYSAKDYDSMDVQKLLSISKKVNSDTDCINMLVKTRNVICIISHGRAQYFANGNLNANGKPIMKIVEPSFRSDHAAFVYEKGSPYAAKFDKIIEQIFKSAIRIRSGTSPRDKLQTSRR